MEELCNYGEDRIEMFLNTFQELKELKEFKNTKKYSEIM